MKYLVNLIAIAVVILLVLAAIEFAKTDTHQTLLSRLQKSLSFLGEYVRIFKHNISLTTAPQRKVPITFVEFESSLRMYVPWVFGKFDSYKWQEFWSLIYAPVQDKKGFLAMKRYRTRREVEDKLKMQYPDPFNRFTATEWTTLWKLAKVSWENAEQQN